MTLKRAFFWLHLAFGVVCGLFIALLAGTGACIAFGPQLVDAAQREIVRVSAAAAPRVSPDDLLKELRRKFPEADPTGITVYADPAAATFLFGGRDKPSYYANPYTGDIRAEGAPATRAFVTFMTGLHRWLALSGDDRELGKIVTGTAAAGFLTLCLSGLILWMPKHLRWRAIKPSVAFVGGATGKARDWNWHNVVGFWSLPVLVVLSGTGVLMSFRPARNLLFLAAGETPPPARQPGRASSGDASEKSRVSPPAPDAKPVAWARILAAAQNEAPGWENIAIRLPASPEAGRRRSDVAGEDHTPRRPRAAGAAPVPVTVKRGDTLPLTAFVTLTLNPYTGEVMRREGFADKSPGEKMSSSVTPVHRGTGFGVAGQFVAFLGALSTLVLVYTGFALTWRRFFPGKRKRHRQHRNPAKPSGVTPVRRGI